VVAKKRTSTGPIQRDSTNVKVQSNTEATLTTAATTTTTTTTTNGVTTDQSGLSLGSHMKQYLGKIDADSITDFPILELSLTDIPEDCDPSCGPAFEEHYKQHCLSIVQSVSELNFSM
jgi:hypothetical protein